jgi:4-carboxymuconolactone decarboxylase
MRQTVRSGGVRRRDARRRTIRTGAGAVPGGPRREGAGVGRGLGDLGRSIVEFVYGDVYIRPGLSIRDREIAAVATLVALGRSSQLPQHLRASLKAGITADELREIILQTATIAGFPPAMNAMSQLKTVLSDHG